MKLRQFIKNGRKGRLWRTPRPFDVKVGLVVEQEELQHAQRGSRRAPLACATARLVVATRRLLIHCTV